MVENRKLNEIKNDILKLSDDEKLDCIKYSSLLSYVINENIKNVPFKKAA